jgi:uncharacterized membrane protein YhhN
MKNKILIPTISFFAVSLLHLYGMLENQFVEMISKPLIIITLIILYISGINRFSFLYFFGLVFSLAGDVILEFVGTKTEFLFTYGLAAFLIAHLFFIAVSSKFLPKVSTTKILLHSLPFLLIYGVLVYTIYPNLGALLIPVIIYGIIISTFGVIAFLIHTHDRSKENLWLFLGATLFIASDSILALNKFYQSSEFLAVAIMITYCAAQYLMCRAMIEKSK